MPKLAQKISLLILFLLCTKAMFGQVLKPAETQALHAYEQHDYSTALAQGETLLRDDGKRVDALFICGESALYLGALELAETYLQRIPDKEKRGLYAVTDYRIAEVKLKLGKCDDARLYFNKYQDLLGRPADLHLMSLDAAINECSAKIAAKPVREKKASESDVVRLGPNVNTTASAISPVRYADRLYFTSSMSTGKGGQTVSRIYTAVRDEPAVPFLGNPKENNVHAAHTALTADASKIYYSLCDGESADNFTKCNIWYRERTYEGGWGPLKKLPSSINMTGYMTFQPATGFDKFLKKDVLFFVSDRPGGVGKLDIWGCTVERDGTFGKPFNLPFNTPDDDVTPYFDNTAQTLFFSSNNPNSTGGFDIFRSEKAATGDWTAPRNLGHTINSSYDDLYFSYHNGSHFGYFSSNRPNEKCPDKPCKYFNIYKAKLYANLGISVFDGSDSTALNSTTIELMDLVTGNIDTTCIKISGNSQYLPLGLGKSYRLIVSKEGYYPYFADINTLRINYPAPIEEKAFLRPMRPKVPPPPARD